MALKLCLIFLFLNIFTVCFSQQEKTYKFEYQIGVGRLFSGETSFGLDSYEGIAVRNEFQYEISNWFTVGASLSIFTLGDGNKLMDYFFTIEGLFNDGIPQSGRQPYVSSEFENLTSFGGYLYVSPVNNKSIKVYVGPGLCYNIYNRQRATSSYSAKEFNFFNLTQQHYKLLGIGFQLGTDISITERIRAGARVNFFLDDVGAALMLNLGYRFSL